MQKAEKLYYGYEIRDRRGKIYGKFTHINVHLGTTHANTQKSHKFVLNFISSSSSRPYKNVTKIIINLSFFSFVFFFFFVISVFSMGCTCNTLLPLSHIHPHIHTYIPTIEYTASFLCCSVSSLALSLSHSLQILLLLLFHLLLYMPF